MTPRLLVALVAMICATALAITLLIVNDDDDAPGFVPTGDPPGLPCERLDGC